MKTKVKICAVIACVLLALAAAASSPVTTSAAQEPKAAPVSPARALNAQERRGRAIYLRGESASGREITAFIGEVDVPASTVTCAGCHGARGEGKTEGGVTAGNLTWANLIKSYGHEHPTGRKHGPFDEAAFARALTDGVDPAGNNMLAAMPHFKMSPDDVADLLAYVKRIEDDRDPGISDSSIKVGTILPSKGSLAELGAAMRDVLAAFFEDVNAKGGIYNRRVELQVADSSGGAAQAAESARGLVREGQVFALVGGFSAGADKELASLAEGDEVPFVGPATLLPQTGFGANRYIFYFLPGMAEQARALVNFGSQRQTTLKSSVALVYAEGEIGEAAVTAAAAQCEKVGCGELKKVSYARGKFDAPSLARSLKGVGAVYFFGSAGDESAFVKEAAAWGPDIFLLGALTGSDLAASVPAGFGGKVFIAFPTVPADVTPEGVGELRALAAKYKFDVRHPAAQLSALAAAKVLAEGLGRGGKDVSREKLITALEGLYEYETGLTPRLTFGPNRRVGASGAYVVTIDAERKEFVSAGGWVKAD